MGETEVDQTISYLKSEKYALLPSICTVYMISFLLFRVCHFYLRNAGLRMVRVDVVVFVVVVVVEEETSLRSM